MKKSSTHMAQLFDCVSKFNNLLSLDISANVLSTNAAKSLCKVIEDQSKLERLNLSSTLKIAGATRLVLNSLINGKIEQGVAAGNTSIKYLNLSLNKFSHIENEFEAMLGRLVQSDQVLQHLDVSYSHINMFGLMFICSNLLRNSAIQSIHLGQTSLDYYGRLFLRHILNASVKYPFRSRVQMCEYVQSDAEHPGEPSLVDRNMIVILNSYMLSNLPPDDGLIGEMGRKLKQGKPFVSMSDEDPIFSGLKGSILKNSIVNEEGVRRVIEEYNDHQNHV